MGGKKGPRNLPPNPERFSITLTYRCNARCSGCNRFLDLWEWDDSDVTLEELEKGYERVREAGITPVKIRMSGGEPLLHPRFEEAIETIQRTWNTWPREQDRHRWVTVFTNGLIPFPLENSIYLHHRVSGTGERKTSVFWPMMLSPHDLRLNGGRGWNGVPCGRQFGCGRLFDCHGFSWCVFAAPFGRMLGIDPYSAEPTTDGTKWICMHCPFSMGVRWAFKMFEEVKAGKLRYPTRTWRKALRLRRGDPMKFERFLDREK